MLFLQLDFHPRKYRWLEKSLLKKSWISALDEFGEGAEGFSRCSGDCVEEVRADWYVSCADVLVSGILDSSILLKHELAKKVDCKIDW